MIDEKTKQQILDSAKSKTFINTKRVARQLNLDPRLVGRVFLEMEKEGLLKRWNKRNWIWVET